MDELRLFEGICRVTGKKLTLKVRGGDYIETYLENGLFQHAYSQKHPESATAFRDQVEVDEITHLQLPGWARGVQRNPNSTCQTCTHSRWVLTPTGKIKKAYAGRCKAPLPNLLEILPYSVTAAYNFNPDLHRTGIDATDGANCPLYQPNATGKLKDETEP